MVPVFLLYIIAVVFYLCVCVDLLVTVMQLTKHFSDIKQNI